MPKHECEEALDRLFEYIDHELPEEELARIGAHLKECPPCEAEHQINEKIKRRVHATGDDCAPDSLRAKVLESIRSARENSGA
jgi:mycothiol system anti-sigma-R factor